MEQNQTEQSKKSSIIEKAIGILFSPFAFSLGFLTPLIAQTLIQLNWVQSTPVALSTGLVIALFFGAIAHFRGSWIWVRS